MGDDRTKVNLVRAFLGTVDPGFVIGIRLDEEWYLPGGVVEGPGAPEGMPPINHFEPLAWHLMQQTGLRLTGLSDAVGVGMRPGSRGTELTVLYAGVATGTQTGGTRFRLDSLPEFAAICSVSHDQIRDICRGLGQVHRPSR
jgi:hypothetical protein